MSVTEKRRPTRKASPTIPPPTAADLMQAEEQFNRVGADFLKADVATALTFSETALDSDDPGKKQRNQRSARKAYDTIVRMAKKITLHEKDASELKHALQQLKANLLRLGETF